jgi:hypothetical protein
MFQLIYDFCLLHINMKHDTSFDLHTNLKNDSLRSNMNIVNMQINDILILTNSNFATAKKKAIVNVKIMIKFRNNLDSNSSLNFNDTIIERQKTTLIWDKFLNLIIFNWFKTSTSQSSTLEIKSNSHWSRRSNMWHNEHVKHT